LSGRAEAEKLCYPWRKKPHAIERRISVRRRPIIYDRHSDQPARSRLFLSIPIVTAISARGARLVENCPPERAERTDRRQIACRMAARRVSAQRPVAFLETYHWAELSGRRTSHDPCVRLSTSGHSFVETALNAQRPKAHARWRTVSGPSPASLGVERWTLSVGRSAADRPFAPFLQVFDYSLLASSIILGSQFSL
jgi:hypothetical protein